MNKFDKFQRILITFLIAVSFFYGGYYIGQRGYVLRVKKDARSIEVINRNPSDKAVDFALFWEVWDKISTQYLERPVDSKKMLYGAISGMVASLGDPYTSFLPPEVNKAVNDSINGSYQGIGAELDIKDGTLIVVSPLDGSPAKAAGITSGDRILSIDDTPTVGISLAEAVSKIRGDAGTTVTLKIQRGNDDPKDMPIKRGVINVASVTWKDEGDGTLYLRVSRFGGDTNSDWAKAITEANVKMGSLDTVVLDLRGNPGGYLQSAYYLADEFIKKGTILWQESPTGDQEPMKATRVGAFENLPEVFVLLDGGSASASEILAAALKENIKATIIGEKSFGKGTIQTAEDFSDGSGVHITIAKWLTPNKNWVHKKGIDPDYKVTLSEEDLKAKKDTQLEKALELAKKI